MEHATSFNVILNFPIEEVWEILSSSEYVDRLFKEQGMERKITSKHESIKEEGLRYEMRRQGSVVSKTEIIQIIDEEEEKLLKERMHNVATNLTTINSYTYRQAEDATKTLAFAHFSLVSDDEAVAKNYIAMIADLARFMFVSLENKLKRTTSLLKVHESRELPLPFKKVVKILENPLTMQKLGLFESVEEERSGRWTVKGIDEKAKRVVQIDKIYEEDEFLLKLVFLNSFKKVEETAQVEVFDMDKNTLVSFESEIPPKLEAKTSTRISTFFDSLIGIPQNVEKMKIVNSQELSM